MKSFVKPNQETFDKERTVFFYINAARIGEFLLKGSAPGDLAQLTLL